MFTIIMAVVALIWAIVLFNVGFKVGVAIANRGKGKTEESQQHGPKSTTSTTTTIAGMSASQYYAQMNNWTNTPTTFP